MIWILFAVVTASAILAVARPLGRAAEPASGGASEIEAYKLQLDELDRELELGEIGKEEALQTRTEISRRMLKASRQDTSAAFSGKPIAFDTNIAFFALAAFIAIGTAGLYAIYGSPSLSDQPLEARLSAPPSQQPIAIQIANVERRLRQAPNDASGWTVIAPFYFASGQFDKAAQAYRKAIKLGGPDEEKLLGLFEALAYGNEGNIPAEGKSILNSALARNPQSLRGRIWLAILSAQEGKKGEAEQIYQEMLGENISGEWKSIIRRQLAGLAESESQGAESAEAPAGDQSAMIGDMVGRLAARLKENGADLNGWLMLIRSYTVLKQPDKAQEAIALARKQFASDPQALEKIEALTRELGPAAEGNAKAPADTSAGPAQTETNTQVPARAVAGDQGTMIRGMVDRLATRLKENGADLDGWLRLIRSYTVLNETAKAQDAAAAARKQFASDSQALEKIEALTRELGVPAADGKGE